MSGGDLDWQLLERLIGLARGGDVRGMLGLPPDADPQTYLLENPEPAHGYTALLAMSVVHILGEGTVLDPDVWVTLQDHFLRYDDEGYLQQWLDVEAATVFSTDHLGLADPVLARQCWQAALEGPYPEGAREQLDALVPTMAPAVRAGLEPLMAG